jgi:hypothetical protein
MHIRNGHRVLFSNLDAIFEFRVPDVIPRVVGCDRVDFYADASHVFVLLTRGD